MTIPQTPVFDGISPEECRRIYECFGVQERCFKPEELIPTAAPSACWQQARPLWSGWISGETAPF